MIKLVAFDWNGTLLADTKIVLAATNHARKLYGYTPLSLRQYQKTFKIPVVEFWVANGGKAADMSAEHYYFYTAYEKALSQKVILRPHVATTLAWLKKQGIKSLIYSNHTKPEIIRQLKRFKINNFFDVVLARQNVDDQTHLHQRSKERKLADYLKQQKYQKHEILSVGDTCEEIEIGRSLKIRTVAITGGENSTNRLKAAKPDFMIQDMKKLTSIIDKLNRHD